MEVGPELDAARFRVVEDGLTPDAIRELTPVVSALPFEALGPVKQSLKRFFSDAPWTADDDDALADIVGAGTGGGNRELEPGLVLTWTWEGGRFRLRVESDAGGEGGGASVSGDDATAVPDLGQTFDGAVVPEATPSPRTIRFATPPLEAGAARNYESATAASADPRVARLFGEFDEVTNVLVGPDFVAVTIGRPNRWEQLLEPILSEVTSEFAGNAPLERGESTRPTETGPAARRHVRGRDPRPAPARARVGRPRGAAGRPARRPRTRPRRVRRRRAGAPPGRSRAARRRAARCSCRRMGRPRRRCEPRGAAQRGRRDRRRRATGAPSAARARARRHRRVDSVEGAVRDRRPRRRTQPRCDRHGRRRSRLPRASRSDATPEG